MIAERFEEQLLEEFKLPPSNNKLSRIKTKKKIKSKKSPLLSNFEMPEQTVPKRQKKI